MTFPRSGSVTGFGSNLIRPARAVLRATEGLIPVLLLFWIWRDGLRCWFIADDFGWLGLLSSVHSFREFLTAMFAPLAQGTIRPWSERGFFMLFESLFGLDALPYRLCAFVTAAIDIVLISRLALRLTGSRFAASVAPVLWASNAALAYALCWTTVYNELLCPMFLLAALLLFIRWAETGRARWWWWQVVVFVLGFGALEINIVYPALAASFCLFVAPREKRRRLLLSVAPLVVISLCYFFIHRLAAPIPNTGVYALHFDERIFATLALYWKWMVLPANWPAIGIGKHTATAAVAFFSAAFAAVLTAALRAGHHEILFGPAWFLVTLAPLLPLLGHRSDYYLTIPAIGIAVAAAQGISLSWQRGWGWRAVVAVVIALYLVAMIRMDRIAAQWWRQRDVPIRALVLGLGQARENHPHKAIVLDGVTDDLYNDALAWQAFRLVGVDHVYLTPASGDNLHPAFEPELLQSFIMEPAVLRRAMLNHSAVIYSFAVDHLRNVTEAYRRRMLDRLSDTAPRRVAIGNPFYAFAFGPQGGPVVSGFRWVPAQAKLRQGNPWNTGFWVRDGTCEPVQLSTTCGGLNPERRNTHLSVTAVMPVGARQCCPERVGSEAVRSESKDRFDRLFECRPQFPVTASWMSD